MSKIRNAAVNSGNVFGVVVTEISLEVRMLGLTPRSVTCDWGRVLTFLCPSSHVWKWGDTISPCWTEGWATTRGATYIQSFSVTWQSSQGRFLVQRLPRDGACVLQSPSGTHCLVEMGVQCS